MNTIQYAAGNDPAVVNSARFTRIRIITHMPYGYRYDPRSTAVTAGEIEIFFLLK